jgi:hypothetical protein
VENSAGFGIDNDIRIAGSAIDWSAMVYSMVMVGPSLCGSSAKKHSQQDDNTYYSATSAE